MRVHKACAKGCQAPLARFKLRPLSRVVYKAAQHQSLRTDARLTDLK
ncbi:hypothetical protein ATI14_2621 [Pseudomonas tolaasii NCPPB 2192]|uniref:Uncharacterized protein n=1 Tax=Pseudomonas tolaasii NCPPB 2192 TaxID=564423 RepID=A0ABX4QFY2_PSETO|nr:hypothetical protein ATI14_2621 [Pseudomonas tolaasii NCPPB 2192]